MSMSAAPRDWESKFSTWTGAPSDSEQERYERTQNAIRQALDAHGEFGDAQISVYAKGSYPNRTNVVRDSDVDIAVEMTNILTLDYEHDAAGMTMHDFGITPYSGGYDYRDLKNDVERAMVAGFGRSAVSRGNVAIHIREGRHSLAADVVPCTSHRVYVSRHGRHFDGVELHPDRGTPIANFPAQHLTQGTLKNTRTSKRYKSTVRILKRLENEMVAENIIKVVPSFLIESAVWNVDDYQFAGATSWTEIVRRVITEVYVATENDEICSKFLEANGIKLLFGSDQSWKREELNHFLLMAWRYIGFS